MRNIFFDLDGTLLHFTEDYDKVVRETFTDVCGFSNQEVVNSYSKNFFENFENFVGNPYKKAFKSVNLDADPDMLVETLCRRELDMCEVPGGARDVLEDLGKSHTLGVLTNGVSDWQYRKLKRFDLLQYFDIIIVSYDVGSHKPDVEIFEYAENNVHGNDFVMVGDSLEDDISGAKNAGWSSELYDSDGFSSLDLVK